MIVPVTVTVSVVLAPCFLPFDSGCANASGASSAQQTRILIGFFMLDLLLMIVRDGWLPFTKGFRGACCMKFGFFSSFGYLSLILMKTVNVMSCWVCRRKRRINFDRPANRANVARNCRRIVRRQYQQASCASNQKLSGCSVL